MKPKPDGYYVNSSSQEEPYEPATAFCAHCDAEYVPEDDEDRYCRWCTKHLPQEA